MTMPMMVSFLSGFYAVCPVHELNASSVSRPFPRRRRPPSCSGKRLGALQMVHDLRPGLALELLRSGRWPFWIPVRQLRISLLVSRLPFT